MVKKPGKRETKKITAGFQKALADGNMALANKFLDNGAVADEPDFITFLAREGKNSALRFLIDAGVNIGLAEGTDWVERTPLHEAAKEGHVETAKLFIEAGAQIGPYDTWGLTPLHLAASNGHAEICRMIIETGIDLNAQSGFDRKGRTALFSAAECRETTEIIRMLADAGADINIRDNFGRTALSEAVFCRNKEAVRLLLDLGCDPNSQGLDSIPAVADAAISEDADMLEMMIKAGANFLTTGLNGDDLIVRTVYYGRPKSVKVLLKYGSDPNAKDHGNNYIIAQAAVNRNSEIVQILLDAGADVNIISGKEGVTPLIEAANYARTDTVRILLAAGADPNITDKNGNTPLMSVIPEYDGIAHKKYLKIISMLLEAGADPNMQNNWQQTALHRAARSGQISVIKKLLKAGADLDIKNNNDMTAFNILKKNHSDLYEKNIQALTALLYKNRHLKEEDARKRVRTDYEFDI